MSMQTGTLVYTHTNTQTYTDTHKHKHTHIPYQEIPFLVAYVVNTELENLFDER